MKTEKSLESQATFNCSTDLGKVIGQADQHHVAPWEVAVIWMFAGVSFAGMLYLGNWSGELWRCVGFGILVSAVGVIFAVSKRFRRKTGVRILREHEKGVSYAHGDVLTEIPYCQLDEYCYKKSRNYSEGWDHFEDYFELEMKSSSFDSPRTIKWRDRTFRVGKAFQLTPFDFDALHTRISKRVAENMAAKLEASQKVPWGRSAYICNDGIEVRVKNGILGSEIGFIPWSGLRDMKFHDGKLMLSLETGNWNVKIPCGEPNLFPGYLLVANQIETHDRNCMLRRQTQEEIATACVQHC